MRIKKHGEHKGNNKQKLAEHELLKAIFQAENFI